MKLNRKQTKISDTSRDIIIKLIDYIHKYKQRLYFIQQQKDLYEKQLIDMGNTLKQKDPQIFMLNSDLQFKDSRISEQNRTLQSKEAEIQVRDALLQQKDTEIQVRDALLQQKDTEIQVRDALLQQKDTEIQVRDALLQQIMSGTVMKIMSRFKLLVERIMPPGTTAYRLYQLMITSFQIMVNEGWGSFWKRYTVWFSAQLSVAKGISASNYGRWIAQNEPVHAYQTKQIKEALLFKYRPKISIITPVWNIEQNWLRKAIESVLAQTYDNWELCIADGGSTKPDNKNVLKEYACRDSRIKIKFLQQNKGISGNSNEALGMSTGEYVALLDQDDELSPFALYEIVKLLNENPSIDIIYSDEDKIDTSGRRYEPFFKPDWSPELLTCYMYMGHLVVYKKELIRKCEGFRSDFDFAQDYDLALRATEMTNNIMHVPMILYHWRSLHGSAASAGKPYARTNNLNAVKSAIQRRKLNATAIQADKGLWINRISYRFDQYPFISIIIPAENKDNAVRCIDSILYRTEYQSFEIVCVTNIQSKQILYRQFINDKRIKIIDAEYPDYASKCNCGASIASGNYLVFVDENVEFIDKNWLQEMVGLFQRPEVGAVGTKIENPDDTIENAGLITGVRGLIGNAFQGYMKNADSYFCFTQCTRNISAISPACLMVSKEVFKAIGEFDRAHTPAKNATVDLCFRIRDKGYFLVYTPYVTVKYSRNMAPVIDDNQIIEREDLYLIKRWPTYIAYDPYYAWNICTYLRAGENDFFRIMPGRNIHEANDKRGNILLISHDLSLSGAPLLLYNIAVYLLKKDYFITVISPVPGELSDQYTNLGISVIIDATILNNMAESTVSLLSTYDLVIANTILTYQAVRIAKQHDVVAVWLIHESQYGKKMAAANNNVADVFDLADLVILSSCYTAGLYTEFSHKNNFEIIYYGIDKPDITGPTLNKPEGKFCILHAGSIEPRKGQDILAQCILNLHKKMAGVFEFYFVGRVLDSAYYQKLRKMTGSLKNVHFTGALDYNELDKYFQMADAFVCSSRDEVLPLTILQAMSHGKAIIATAVGGIPEIIENKVDGIIIPSDDPIGMVRELIGLYESPHLKQSLGINARHKFVGSFTLEKYGDRFLQTIQSRVGQIGNK